MNQYENKIVKCTEGIKNNFMYIQKGNANKPWLQGRLHSWLSMDYFDLGMYYIALGNYPCAKGAFFNSVAMRYWIFKNYLSIHDWTEKEIDEMGEDYEENVLILPGYLAAAAWKELFCAVLINHPCLADFVRLYAIIVKRTWAMYEHVSGARYTGLLICSVFEDNHELACLLQKEKKPNIEPMFRGIPECLEFLVHKQKTNFFDALLQAEKQWKRIAEKEEKDMPYSTCFIYGACLLKLSEFVFGKNVIEEFFAILGTKSIPANLFNEAISVQDTCPIPNSVTAPITLVQ